MLLSGFDTRGKNGNELIAFMEGGSCDFVFEQSATLSDFEIDLAFAKFFQANAQFM